MPDKKKLPKSYTDDQLKKAAEGARNDISKLMMAIEELLSNAKAIRMNISHKSLEIATAIGAISVSETMMKNQLEDILSAVIKLMAEPDVGIIHARGMIDTCVAWHNANLDALNQSIASYNSMPENKNDPIVKH